MGMKKKPNPSAVELVRFNLVIPTDLRQKIKIMAAEEGISMAELVRAALKKYTELL